MSEAVVLTANATNQMVLTTKLSTKSVSVIVTAASSLGGGTLTLKVRPARTSVTPETIDTLTVGSRANYVVGGDMEVFVNLTGATAPSTTLMFAEIY